MAEVEKAYVLRKNSARFVLKIKMLLVVLCDCEKEVVLEDLIHLWWKHVGLM